MKEKAGSGCAKTHLIWPFCEQVTICPQNYLYLNAFVECDVGTKANLKLFIYLEETEQYCMYVRIYWIFMLADASFLIYSSMRGGEHCAQFS